MALQIPYFCPHGQRHGRVSQSYLIHGHGTQLMLHKALHTDV
ncbi:hypothetical protein F383_36755 [Gossypium arboreum]|uniref:Uncharacterized protein n=1 Tax=Gossypium arboreum TaxID=29729 RepID=A0A0B0MEL4_GOSAR|nr:hypothetical protein F383_36755 [Gossypium arboreum]